MDSFCRVVCGGLERQSGIGLRYLLIITLVPTGLVNVCPVKILFSSRSAGIAPPPKLLLGARESITFLRSLYVIDYPEESITFLRSLCVAGYPEESYTFLRSLSVAGYTEESITFLRSLSVAGYPEESITFLRLLGVASSSSPLFSGWPNVCTVKTVSGFLLIPCR